MARLLGANGYGVLSGAVALFTTFAQLAGLGTGLALVRYLSRDGKLPGRYRATLRVYLLSSLILFLLLWPASQWLLGNHITSTPLACLALAELLFAPALLPLAYRYQAEERMGLFGAVLTVPPLARFVALLLAIGFNIRSLEGFSALYLAVLAFAVMVILISQRPSAPQPGSPTSLRETIREGLPFTVSGIAVTAGNELDKTLLLRIAGGAVAGEYTAAQRIIQAATLPVNSLVLAVTPRLFRNAHVTSSRDTEKVLIIATLFYASIAASSMWIMAPLAPMLLGEGFQSSEKLLRFMCLMLVSSSLRQMLVAQLTGTGMQRNRNWIEGMTTIAAIPTLLVVIPHYGGIGAITVAVVADMVIVALAHATLNARRR